MPWLTLFFAGLFEVGWAIGLKYTEGFTRLWPSVATIAAMLVSFFLLGRAVRDLPLGTAYAIWTGIGTIGTATFGIVVLKEPATAMRLACLVMIVAGIVGLKLLSVSGANAATSTP
jgi:quaternary ammonium compound-resistance protein SugE